MTELVLGGQIDSALSHLALVGLAVILEDRAGDRPRMRWSEHWPSRPHLSTDLAEATIASAVRGHARAHAQPGSWVMQRVRSGKRSGSGLLTVRAPSPASVREWEDLARCRRQALGLRTDGTAVGSMSLVDLQMVVGLGEPAFWAHEHPPRRVDDGASRWEMKTRNRGEEFLRDRLAHLAHHVGSRSAAAVLAGLKGSAIVDEAGKCGLDSRSSTGLTTPGPTDNAVAWCALWGISALPTIHRLVADSSSAGMSQSPGTWPRNRVHPHYFGVPVFTEATTRGRWSAIVTSRPFDDVFKALTRTAGVEDAAPGHAPAGAPASWLREQGVRAIVVFECQVVGSKSAPERRLLTGRVHPL